MKIRRLERLNDAQKWVGHGYAIERDGQCLFRFNTLVWGRIGARHNAQMKQDGTKLKDVHKVVLIGDRLRWLEIEEIEGDPEEIMARLDEECEIPRPQKVTTAKLQVA